MTTSFAHAVPTAESTPGTPLLAVASAIAAASDANPGEELVIVLRPDRDDHKIVAGGGNAPIRAAVSVAVAAGNKRIWDGINDAAVALRPVASLPEVVRAIADGCGVTSLHVGVVGPDGSAIAIWFEFGDDTTTTDDDRSDVLAELARAIEEDDRREAELAAEAAELAAAAATESAAAAKIDLPVGSGDPDVDVLTGLASRARFDQALGDFEGDEATVLLIDLDDFTAFNETHGTEAGDEVLRETARRLAAGCRRDDVVARLDSDQFAIVLSDADRASALQASKRLLQAITEPQPGLDDVSVTATLAFAHELGLVDMDELFEMAEEAMVSGKRGGAGRIVLAS